MRSTSAAVCGLALLTAAAAPAAPTTAAKPDPKVVAQAQALARSARDSRSEAQGVQAQIANLKTQLVQLASVEAAGERGAGDKRSRLDALNAREQVLTADLGKSQNGAARLLGVMALFRRDPPPALLVHPASARDAVRAQILARAMAPELERRAKVLAAQIEDLRRLRRQLKGLSEDLFASESQLAEQREQLERLMADRAALQKSLIANAESAEAALRALAAKSRVPAELIGRLPSVAQALGPAPDHFIAPVQGQVYARYGEGGGRDGASEGWHWKALPGAPVLAPAASVVEYAGPLKDYGTVVILQAGGGLHLVLTGLDAAGAVTGQGVAAGEPIGRMAEDGGPHPLLYLEVRRGNSTVDPARWFKVAGAH
jgi:septal ring factor EnvC (AmiA/AmiB activator)